MDELEEALVSLKPDGKKAEALRRLYATTDAPNLHLPVKRTASVLALLSMSDNGLEVLLTTRALTLRTSPGETALPGGRLEPQDDGDVHACALREAFEEVGLPLDTPLLRLTTLPAFLSYTLLYVVPVVYLLNVKDPQKVLSALKPNPAEVSAIFSAELSRFRSNGDIRQAYSHSHHDLDWIAEKPFRLHSFEDPSFASDVTGLTADILLSLAELAAGSDSATSIVRRAPGQLPWQDLVQHVLDGKEARVRAK